MFNAKGSIVVSVSKSPMTHGSKEDPCLFFLPFISNFRGEISRNVKFTPGVLRVLGFSKVLRHIRLGTNLQCLTHIFHDTLVFRSFTRIFFFDVGLEERTKKSLKRRV